MTEPRLIDADALMETIYEHDYELRTRTGSTDYGMFSSGIYQAIDEQPTVDPESLRPHGRWIGIEYDGYADGCPVYDLWECSNCGEEVYGEDVPEQNSYCRGCGATMDLEEENDQD